MTGPPADDPVEAAYLVTMNLLAAALWKAGKYQEAHEALTNLLGMPIPEDHGPNAGSFGPFPINKRR